MVVRGAFEEGDRASWDIRDRSGEAVFDAPFEPARVERVEIGVERCVALSFGQKVTDQDQQRLAFRYAILSRLLIHTL